MKVKLIDFKADSDLSILSTICQSMMQGNFIVVHQDNIHISWLEDTCTLYGTNHGKPYNTPLLAESVYMIYEHSPTKKKIVSGIHGTAEHAYNICGQLARGESTAYYIIECHPHDAYDFTAYIEHCCCNSIPIPLA
jgi:hypothetical protein